MVVTSFEIRNNTASSILVQTLGFVVPALTTIDTTRMFTEFELRNASDLTAFISSGDLTVIQTGIEMPLQQWEDFQSGGHPYSGNLWVNADHSVDMTVSGIVGVTVSGVTITGGNVTIESGPNVVLAPDVPSNSMLITSYDDPDVDSITASGVTFTGSVNFDTVGDTTITLGISMDDATNTLTISGGQTSEQQKLAIGKIYQVSYGENGIATDKWLDVGHGNPSNRSPHIILWPTEMVGFSFSNRNNDIDIDVELWLASETEGSAANLLYTWELRNMRTWHTTQVLTSSGTPVTFVPGDKLGMFIRGVSGAKTQDPVVNVYLQIDAIYDDEDFENYTGDFSVV
jgi:hypothetical protein